MSEFFFSKHVTAVEVCVWSRSLVLFIDCSVVGLVRCYLCPSLWLSFMCAQSGNEAHVEVTTNRELACCCTAQCDPAAESNDEHTHSIFGMEATFHQKECRHR